MPGEHAALCHLVTQSAEVLLWLPLQALETACYVILGERRKFLWSRFNAACMPMWWDCQLCTSKSSTSFVFLHNLEASMAM